MMTPKPRTADRHKERIALRIEAARSAAAQDAESRTLRRVRTYLLARAVRSVDPMERRVAGHLFDTLEDWLREGGGADRPRAPQPSHRQRSLTQGRGLS